MSMCVRVCQPSTAPHEAPSVHSTTLNEYHQSLQKSWPGEMFDIPEFDGRRKCNRYILIAQLVQYTVINGGEVFLFISCVRQSIPKSI